MEKQWSAALMHYYCHPVLFRQWVQAVRVLRKDSADRSCHREEKAFLFPTHMHTQSPQTVTTLEQLSLHAGASPLGVLWHRFLVREHKSLSGFCLHESSDFLKGEKDKRAELKRWNHWSLQQVLDTTVHSEKGEVHRPSELWHYRQKCVYAVHKRSVIRFPENWHGFRNIFTVRKTFYQFISIFWELLLAKEAKDWLPHDSCSLLN